MYSNMLWRMIIVLSDIYQTAPTFSWPDRVLNVLWGQDPECLPFLFFDFGNSLIFSAIDVDMDQFHQEITAFTGADYRRHFFQLFFGDDKDQIRFLEGLIGQKRNRYK